MTGWMVAAGGVAALLLFALHRCEVQTFTTTLCCQF
eukprot:COSAG02_NODE_27250_length_614_cov_0.502913_1_plen_35_part_01